MNKLLTKVFGTTSFSLTVEGMGPYPLSDSTNLLGPSTSLAPNASCYTNYGTNIHTPVPIRKCYYDYNYDRDNFRRHSAHGRICTSSGRLLNVLCFLAHVHYHLLKLTHFQQYTKITLNVINV